MVNDCAFVGETLLKHMPKDIEKQHIRRTRGLWSKTFGLAYNILRAEGDVYHVHYLLQDCYIAALFRKKPLVGHAHGSDLRKTLKHPLLGRMVKYNLIKCDKILVSTPDILADARRFRRDAEYLPNPVDAQIFYPKLMVTRDSKKKVLIASDCNWAIKGTDLAIRALSRIKDEVEVSIIKHGADFEKTLALASSLGLHLNILPKIEHDRIREYYWSADIVVDQFKSGVFGMVSLEAIACGRPTITYISSEYSEYEDFPLKNVNTEERVISAIGIADAKLWQKEYAYLEKNHKPEIVVRKLMRIYEF